MQIGSWVHLKLAEALVQEMAYSEWPKLSWHEHQGQIQGQVTNQYKISLGELEFLIVLQEAVFYSAASKI